ncbi:uncharacterized protein LOC125489513 [Plutella xylostella]|uniref:uncharacterized protein LOC125489513 n=1 Tax=Plutella xylostella TaxID=51655 RepID=UPI002032B179|nr:uncharacterized protein LOC125489513 [Plutella xylostella]
MRVNVYKTKDMRINTDDIEPIQINGKNIEQVEKFCYLGSMIDHNGGTDIDVEARINKARAVFGQLKNFWRSKNINRNTKIRIFNSNVKTVLLYGCETWFVRKDISYKLQVFINKCLRQILGIFWPRTIRNEDLWTLTNQRPTHLEILDRKWRWIGHSLRQEDSRLTKQALVFAPQGKRRIGRPRITWIRTLAQEIKSINMSWPEVVAAASDRQKWKAVVAALCSTRS